MPLYEYLCPVCRSKFELLRKASQMGDEASCPRCQSTSKRVLSTFQALSRDAHGFITPAVGNPCTGCSTDSCQSCNL